jgi:zinc protease
MQGRAREFEQIVEILRAALVTTPLTVENVARVREGRIKVLKETSISPAMLADRAIAARLFGEFPYGRPYIGTVESLERIDRADLMLARERFLNPNNATLAVIGNVQPNRAKRVLRQLLGVWRKSDQLVPATFRQPAMPDSRTLIINAPGNQSVEVRLAVRGLARNDPDAVAATLLSGVTRSRWEKLFPDLALKPVFARHDAFALPGMFVMGATVDNLLAGKTLAAAQKVIKGFAGSAVTIEELEQAKSELMISANKQLASLDGFTEAWLDIDTYGLPSVAEQTRTIKAISTTDLQRVAQRLFREGAFASVVIGNAELVKTQIEPHGKVELMGELDSGSEAKPSISPQAKPALKPE